VDIVVRGRHLDVSDSFREHAADKLERVSRFDPRLTGVDVEVVKQQNPRLADAAIRVELTCRGSGPVVRAEASAGDKTVAFDTAFSRLEERLRRAHDRRRDHHRTPMHTAAAELSGTNGSHGAGGGLAAQPPAAADPDTEPAPLVEMIGDGPLVVREKHHTASPMTVGDALHQMELVGHDFYLFVDKESELPSVVYRRRGYDYGLLRLSIDPA